MDTGSGGGGSFVYVNSDVVLLIAGGGGGADIYQEGGIGRGPSGQMNAGSGLEFGGGGGAGFYFDADGPWGGKGLPGGFAGGRTVWSEGHDGGFGGGGASGDYGSGGGGGYSGGDGGLWSGEITWPSTGGTSLNWGTNGFVQAGSNPGNGWVEINFISVPEPSALTLVALGAAISLSFRRRR